MLVEMQTNIQSLVVKRRKGRCYIEELGGEESGSS